MPTTRPGAVLMVGIGGPELDPATVARLERLGPAGVVLFRRNLASPPQTARLIRELRRTLPGPLLVAIDQEGGPVSRLAGWIGATPAAADLAARGPADTRAFGSATARALRSLGFDLDFAPVVDLCDRGVPNGIGARSFGVEAARATELAGAFLRGLQSGGVAGCLKHFPGLGGTAVDSHAELPTDPRPAADLEGHDLVPFRELAPEAAAVMVGHGRYPGLDGPHAGPATLSPRVVAGLLVSGLAFGGLVVTDDLEMGAVRERDVEGRAAPEALSAGCDLLLYCAELDRAEAAASAIDRRAAADGGFAARLAVAAAAVRRTASRWVGGADAPSGWEEASRALARFSIPARG